MQMPHGIDAARGCQDGRVNPIPGELIPLLIPLVVLELGLAIWALWDLSRPGRRVRGESRLLWAIIILFASLIGPILYFVAGRQEAGATEDEPPRRLDRVRRAGHDRDPPAEAPAVPPTAAGRDRGGRGRPAAPAAPAADDDSGHRRQRRPARDRDPAGSRSATPAGSWPSTGSTWSSPRVPSSGCSVRTGRARPPPCGSWPGWPTPRPAGRRSPGRRSAPTPSASGSASSTRTRATTAGRPAASWSCSSGCSTG